MRNAPLALLKSLSSFIATLPNHSISIKKVAAVAAAGQWDWSMLMRRCTWWRRWASFRLWIAASPESRRPAQSRRSYLLSSPYCRASPLSIYEPILMRAPIPSNLSHPAMRWLLLVFNHSTIGCFRVQTFYLRILNFFRFSKTIHSALLVPFTSVKTIHTKYSIFKLNIIFTFQTKIFLSFRWDYFIWDNLYFVAE